MARFGIVGRKDSGKTTLVCRLVEHFTDRGMRVATVKHASSALAIDHAGTDSDRHRGAGASEVAVVGASRWAVMHELRGAPEPSLDEIVQRMSVVDLLLIEGFKREPHAKIEICAGGAPLDPASCPNIVERVGEGMPMGRDDIVQIASVIASHLDLNLSDSSS